MGGIARAVVGFAVAFGVGPWIAACTAGSAFDCTSDDQCIDGVHQGRCEPTGWCSFPSADCPSRYQYAPHAGDGLGGTCVDHGGSSSGPGPSTGAVASDEGGSTTGLPGPADSGSSTGQPVDPGTTTSGALDSGSESESTGTPQDPLVFFDDFERPDDPALGNGWVEKLPSAFQLVGGEVVFESMAGGYEDNLCYRDESLADVEVCVDFRLQADDPDNHPQVQARMQPEGIEQPGSVTSYILYVEPSTLRVRLDIGGALTEQWEQPLTTPMEAGPWYRLCLTVLGAEPVDLHGVLEIEQAGGWRPHTEIAVLDDTPAQIVDPGATGISGADAPQVVNLVYDNFRRTSLQ